MVKKETINLPFSDLNRFEFSKNKSCIHYEVNGKNLGTDALYQLQPGVVLRIMNFTTHTMRNIPEFETLTKRIRYPSKKLIFAIKLKGNSHVKIGEHFEFQLNEGALTVAYSDSEVEIEETEQPKKEYLMVMLLCEPQVLLSPPFNLKPDSLPFELHKTAKKERLNIKTIAMNESVALASNILLTGEPSDDLSNAFIKAKTVELVCLVLRNLRQAESQTQLSLLPNKDRKILERAGVLLAENWCNPPAQDDLAKQLGVNKSKLKQGFKLIHGCTMKEYILNIRLLQAQKLLAQGNLNVTQVALEVGYEYSSNFTSAFKEKFNISPKTFQKMTLLR